MTAGRFPQDGSFAGTPANDSNLEALSHHPHQGKIVCTTLALHSSAAVVSNALRNLEDGETAGAVHTQQPLVAAFSTATSAARH